MAVVVKVCCAIHCNSIDICSSLIRITEWPPRLVINAKPCINMQRVIHKVPEEFRHCTQPVHSDKCSEVQESRGGSSPFEHCLESGGQTPDVFF